MGIRDTPQFISGTSERMVGICQQPLTIMATLPEINWFITSPWVQLMHSLLMAPLETSSCAKVSAATPASELKLV